MKVFLDFLDRVLAVTAFARSSTVVPPPPFARPRAPRLRPPSYSGMRSTRRRHWMPRFNPVQLHWQKKTVSGRVRFAIRGSNDPIPGTETGDTQRTIFTRWCSSLSRGGNVRQGFPPTLSNPDWRASAAESLAEAKVEVARGALPSPSGPLLCTVIARPLSPPNKPSGPALLRCHQQQNEPARSGAAMW